MKKVSCVIMDWAGTAVDFGCFAPLNAFLKVFQEQGVTITYRQAREPMGLLKIEHIKAILKMPEVSERFRTAHGREWNQNDVAIMYQSFEKHLFASLQDFTTPVPGVIETMEQLRREGIRIGSTTGYTDENCTTRSCCSGIYCRLSGNSGSFACRTPGSLYDLPEHDRAGDSFC